MVPTVVVPSSSGGSGRITFLVSAAPTSSAAAIFGIIG